MNFVGSVGNLGGTLTDKYGTGEIIFGGVNRHKFVGQLEPVPIWPPPSEQSPYWIQYANPYERPTSC